MPGPLESLMGENHQYERFCVIFQDQLVPAQRLKFPIVGRRDKRGRRWLLWVTQNFQNMSLTLSLSLTPVSSISPLSPVCRLKDLSCFFLDLI